MQISQMFSDINIIKNRLVLVNMSRRLLLKILTSPVKTSSNCEQTTKKEFVKHPLETHKA